MSETVARLHISPFTPDLLPVILGSSLSKSAQNVSYHTIQTFPEKSYGYVELPNMEAETVKKKLNGAILKGQKVKIEEARPKKRRRGGEEAAATVATDEIAPRRSKRTKKESGGLSGHELPPDRKVKRGWTEPKVEKSKHKKKDGKEKKKRQQTSSKFTEKEELLFKTKVPKNKKSSSSKTARKEKEKSGVDVVHEFENHTAVPSFLRDSKVSGSKTALIYKDGEGWVNEDGKVVEQESGAVSRKRQKVKSSSAEGSVKSSQTSKKSTVEPEPPSPPSSSSDSDEERVSKGLDACEETSSSGSSDESDAPESEDEPEVETTNTQKPNINTVVPPQTPAIPTPDQEIHPLEALFKKPKLPQLTLSPSTDPNPPKSSSSSRRPTLELDTKFTFFGSSNQQEDNETSPDNPDDVGMTHNLHPPIPTTPFSTQDHRSRSLRSAAPTPDTAMPTRSHTFSFSLGDTVTTSPSPTSPSPSSSSPPPPSTTASHDPPHQTDTTSKDGASLAPSAFETSFWSNRGENNRSWKARRRAVLKENRQRENRARRPKAW